jgi:hypothetical protein
MNFVQKLIDDTKNGMWNYDWKYNDGSKIYTFNKPKHFLGGLNFMASIENKDKEIIFPNGVALETEQIKELEEAVIFSLEATVDDSMKRYIAGKEITQEEEDAQAEKDALKKSADVKTTEPKVKPKESVAKK